QEGRAEAKAGGSPTEKTLPLVIQALAHPPPLLPCKWSPSSPILFIAVLISRKPRRHVGRGNINPLLRRRIHRRHAKAGFVKNLLRGSGMAFRSIRGRHQRGHRIGYRLP